MAISNKLMMRLLSGFVLGPLTLLIIYWGGVPFFLLSMFLCAVSFYEWLNMAKKRDKPLFPIISGWLYIGFSFCCFIFLRSVDNGMVLTIILLLSVWGSDVGAYVFGKKWGKKKFAPTISPNKTWAGFAGALIGAAIAFLAVFPFFVLDDVTGAILLLLVLLGYAIGATGQVGDLFISIQKRKVGVKDTGNLIPGHGGILDRIDALLLACPVFVAMLIIWGQIS